MANDPQSLLALQNADGGWSYRHGGSWVEPTCFALMALVACGMEKSPFVRRGIGWLKTCQRTDGGFAPRQSVDQSTWITALVLLLPASVTAEIPLSSAIQWLLAQSGHESDWVFRLRLFLLGTSSGLDTSYAGWPWYPGTAAWIAPTAITILAMEKALAQGLAPEKTKEISSRLQQARSFLLVRRCSDGGWNHGSTRALGYDSDSYPESTGIALLALHGQKSEEIERGIVRAESHLKNCRSNEAAQWLRLGLFSHGRKVSFSQQVNSHGCTMENALTILANSAENGRNLLA